MWPIWLSVSIVSLRSGAIVGPLPSVASGSSRRASLLRPGPVAFRQGARELASGRDRTPHTVRMMSDGLSGCLLSDVEHDTPSKSYGGMTNEDANSVTLYDMMLLFAPIVLPCLAFLTFDTDVQMLHNFMEMVANNAWVSVDGGLSRTAALLPLMTGIVLPCVSFALGTLTATTISTLRQRQVQLRTELNTEACLIRNVLSAVEAIFPADVCECERLQAALLLRQYCSRVIIESRSGINMAKLELQGAANSELDGLTRLLHHSEQLPTDYDRGRQPRFVGTTEFVTQMYIEKLQFSRSARLAVLETTFPTVHWLALMLLGSSIIFSFLLAADQETVLFLAKTQLRFLFSILIGALTATGCICADLNDPFRGAFRITPTTEQLVLIREIISQELMGNVNWLETSLALFMLTYILCRLEIL